MGFKKNEVFVADIIDITNLGFGVAKREGEVVFVSGTVPGDVVRVKIIKSEKSYSIGRAEEIITPSPMRVGDRCENSACRSCAYKCISYSDEAKIKEESVRQVFKKAGLSEVRVMPLVKSPIERGYRNKAQYPVARGKGGEYIIGFEATGSSSNQTGYFGGISFDMVGIPWITSYQEIPSALSVRNFLNLY